MQYLCMVAILLISSRGHRKRKKGLGGALTFLYWMYGYTDVLKFAEMEVVNSIMPSLYQNVAFEEWEWLKFASLAHNWGDNTRLPQPVV